MKICVAQTRPVKGDVEANIADHKKMISLAMAEKADMIIFPELSLTGYEPGLAKELATTKDDSRFDDFQILSNTHNIITGVGMPVQGKKGNCISMIIFQPHKERLTYSKKYLHADEEPFFISGENFSCLKVGNANIGLAICYELSVSQHSEDAFKSGAQIYIASVAKTASGVEKSFKTLTEIAVRYGMTVLFSNSIGPSDDFISAGNSAAWNNNGHLLGKLNDTQTGILMLDTDSGELVIKPI
jgi:predicted amidohydrolase